jgi:hypothetical protein
MNNTVEETLTRFYIEELMKLGVSTKLISKSEVKEIFGIGPAVVERWVGEGKLMPVLESKSIKYLEWQVGKLAQELIRHNSGKSKGEQ